MTDFYVSQQRGNDLTGTGTPANPFRTTATAVTAMANGDRVGIFPGTYPPINGALNLSKTGQFIGLTEGKDLSGIVFEAPGLVYITRQMLDLSIVGFPAIQVQTNLVPNFNLRFQNLVVDGEEFDVNKTGRHSVNLNNYLGATFINCILLGGWESRTDLPGGSHVFTQCTFTLWPNAFLGNTANIIVGIMRGLSPFDSAGGHLPYLVNDSIFHGKLLVPVYYAQTIPGPTPVRGLVSNYNCYFGERAGRFAFNTNGDTVVAADFAAWQALSLTNDNLSINADPLIDELNLWKPTILSPVINKGSGYAYRFTATDIGGSTRG